MLLESKRIGEEGRKYWRCGSLRGKNGTAVGGYTFTPSPSHGGSKNPYNIKRRKKPVSRHMLCTDVQIEEATPEHAFINAWNHLVDEREKYLLEWQQTISGSDILKAYRAKEMIRLINETGHINTIPYELMLKTLDHIEIGFDGTAEVIFLAGMTINFEVQS